MNLVASNSIVNLFKQSSKPRTKLFIQSIPPGYTEDEFKELIQNYWDGIDYFLFKPGKIIRDPYGHLIGLDNPNYGFAVINFKDHTNCPKFNREFNQMFLFDCYNLKSKLIIEFALMQEIPSIPAASLVSPSSISFRDLPVYKDFLKTFPFAAKGEEERLADLFSHSINLDDSSFTEAQTPVNVSEMETKLSVLPSPSLSSLPQLSYASLLADKCDSAEAITPLTEFIDKSGAAAELLPRIDKREQRRRQKEIMKDEQKKQREKNQKDRKQRRKEVKAAEKKSFKESEKKSVKEAEKKSFKSQQQQSQQQAAPLIGTPKILARKQSAHHPEHVAAVPVNEIVTPKIENFPKTGTVPGHQEKIKTQINAQEGNHQINVTSNKSRRRTLSERSVEEPQRKPREPYIRPEDRVPAPGREERNDDNAFRSTKPEASIVQVGASREPYTRPEDRNPVIAIVKAEKVDVPVVNLFKPAEPKAEVIIASVEVKSEVKSTEIKTIDSKPAANIPEDKAAVIKHFLAKPAEKSIEKPVVKQADKKKFKEKPVDKAEVPQTDKSATKIKVNPVEKSEVKIIEKSEVIQADRPAVQQAQKLKVKTIEKSKSEVKPVDSKPVAKMNRSQPASPTEPKPPALQKSLKTKPPKSQPPSPTPLEVISPTPAKKVFTSSEKKRELQSN